MFLGVFRVFVWLWGAQFLEKVSRKLRFIEEVATPLMVTPLGSALDEPSRRVRWGCQADARQACQRWSRGGRWTAPMVHRQGVDR